MGNGKIRPTPFDETVKRMAGLRPLVAVLNDGRLSSVWQDAKLAYMGEENASAWALRLIVARLADWAQVDEGWTDDDVLAEMADIAEMLKLEE